MYDVFGISALSTKKKESKSQNRKSIEMTKGFLLPKDLHIQPSRLTNLFLRANETQFMKNFIKPVDYQENVDDLAIIDANNNTGLTDNEPMSAEYQNNFENIFNAKTEKVTLSY